MATQQRRSAGPWNRGVQPKRLGTRSEGPGGAAPGQTGPPRGDPRRHQADLLTHMGYRFLRVSSGAGGTPEGRQGGAGIRPRAKPHPTRPAAAHSDRSGPLQRCPVPRLSSSCEPHHAHEHARVQTPVLTHVHAGAATRQLSTGRAGPNTRWQGGGRARGALLPCSRV